MKYLHPPEDLRAFAGCDALEEIYLPDSVESVDSNAFGRHPKVVISAHKDSFAERCCKKYRWTYREVE